MPLHVETKHLTNKLKNIDDLFEHQRITEAEYIQIGLLLKITELLNNINNKMDTKNDLRLM